MEDKLKNLQKEINSKYRETLELRFSLNRLPRYSLKWLNLQEQYRMVFADLQVLEANKNKILGGAMKAQNQSTKGGTRKSSRANGNVSKDAVSPSTEKLSQVLTQVTNEIAEKQISGKKATTSPKILKKKKVAKKKLTAKQKSDRKKINGVERLEKKADSIREIAKAHGTEIKRVWKKNQKRQEVVKAMAKHSLTESQVYQTMNYLQLIKTAGAQKKLARMKEAGLL